MNVPHTPLHWPGGPSWSSAVYSKGQPLSSQHEPLQLHPEQQPPQIVQANLEINALVDLYQQQLVELNAAHSLLMEDQDRLARMVSPFVDETGRAKGPVNEDVLFFKRGLDLRLMEFDEDCRRIKITEQTLQRRLDDLALGYDAMVMEAHGFAESRLMHQINDLRKVVGLLQLEMDEIRFQRDIFADEAKRLRGVCRYGDWIQDGFAAPLQPHEVTPRTLHQAFSGTPAGLQHHAHAHKGEAISSPRKARGEEAEGGAARESLWPPTPAWGGILSNLFGAASPAEKAAGKAEKLARKAAPVPEAYHGESSEKRKEQPSPPRKKFTAAPPGPPPRKTSAREGRLSRGGVFSATQQPLPSAAAAVKERGHGGGSDSAEVVTKIIFSKRNAQPAACVEERSGDVRRRSESLYTPSRYGSSLLSVADRESEASLGSLSEDESVELRQSADARIPERIPLRKEGRRHEEASSRGRGSKAGLSSAGAAAERLSERLQRRLSSRTVPPPESNTLAGSVSPHSALSRQLSAAFLGSVEESSERGSTPRIAYKKAHRMRREDSLRSDPGTTLRVLDSPRRRGYSSEEIH